MRRFKSIRETIQRGLDMAIVAAVIPPVIVGFTFGGAAVGLLLGVGTAVDMVYRTHRQEGPLGDSDG